MSDHSIPKTVDPLKYADQNKVLDGKIALKTLSRLRDIVLETDGDVNVALEFDRDQQGLRVINGTLDAELTLTCQRCLEPVVQNVHSDLSLGIVLSDEQAKNLPGYYEPLLVSPESMSVYEVVEEELILSLPMFAYHENCGDKQPKEQAEAESVKRENPFSVLAELKLKK